MGTAENVGDSIVIIQLFAFLFACLTKYHIIGENMTCFLCWDYSHPNAFEDQNLSSVRIRNVEKVIYQNDDFTHFICS